MVTATGWPPPATSKRDWFRRQLVIRGRKEPVKVREVKLWGRDVLINEAFDVYCLGCMAFRTVRELGSAANTCPVGIVRAPGAPRRFDSADPLQDGPADAERPTWMREVTREAW